MMAETKKEFYYIIHNGGDGINIDQVTREELLKRLQPEEPDNPGSAYYGTREVIPFPSGIRPSQNSINSEHLRSDVLIILKGRPIIPVPKKVVTEWEVE